MEQDDAGREMRKAIVFDIDGVLVDVSRSYRMAIKKTAEFFLGRVLAMGEVEDIKNRGVNDDWDAAEIIIRKYGGDFKKNAIIKKFQEYYVGKKFDGLIKNEELLIKQGTIKKLAKLKLGIFTGRPKVEAEYVLERFKISRFFKAVVAREDVKEGKPNPDGLLKILQKFKVKPSEALFVGDSLADLYAAKNAGVGFVGISGDEYVKSVLKSEGAEIILNNVNEIIKVK
jgi:HAD superfamily phosphatase